MEKELNGKMLVIPEHVAIILDGNGRWAKKRLMPRNYGHSQGAKTVEQICEDAWDIGIKYLTVYAFSTENWRRPDKEVKALMRLLRKYLKDCIERTAKNNMRVRVIGEKSRLDDDIRAAIDELEEVSAANTEERFASYLDTKDLPDPDLMIRTSGEQRLSNWLLWQLAYAEFYFTDVLWPDFDKQELIRAVEYYNTRERRFGGV